MKAPTPTSVTYDGLNAAFRFFNKRLFAGELPACLITMQRTAKAYGYFAGERFGARNGGGVTDEIALNPTHFKDRTTEQTLSTLVHEMVHEWQHRFGEPSRAGYHNKEWAAKMREVGLIPSSTGAAGGKETGQRVSHYIEKGGAFAKAFRDLKDDGFLPIELWGDDDSKKTRKKKAASKTKYTCEPCGANAWGKPDMNLVCGDCRKRMVAEPTDDEEDGDED